MQQNQSIKSTFFGAFASLAFIGCAASPLYAEVVTMTADENNELRVTFTAPTQPDAHNAIQLNVQTASRSGSLTAIGAIYEDGVVLGSGDIFDNSIVARFADPSSSFAASSADTIDFFGTIADGVVDGEFVVVITGEPGGQITFDTTDLFITTFGDDGGYSAFYPQVTSVIIGDASTTLIVDIDIKPDSDPNSINLCSGGAVPVAILGSDTFDVFEVDTETLRFADAAVKVVGRKELHSLCSYEDVNDDGFDDLVCHYVTTDIAALDGDSMSATVNGELLLDGTPFEGSDSINIVKDTCN